MSGIASAPDGRRQAPRLATNLRVNYASSGGRDPASAYTIDLSMGGMFLQTTEDFSPRSWLQLGFQVSVEADRRPVQVFAQVIRTLNRANAAQYGLLPGVAVEFRKFVEGRDELRLFLARKLGLPAEDLGYPLEGEVPDEIEALTLGRPTPAVSVELVASVRPPAGSVRPSVPTRGLVEAERSKAPVQPRPPVEPERPAGGTAGTGGRAPGDAAPPKPQSSAAAVSRPAAPPPAAPRQEEAPVRARGYGNFEPPPVSSRTRNRAGGIRPKDPDLFEVPDELPDEAPGGLDTSQWDQEKWQTYFASMRREKESKKPKRGKEEDTTELVSPLMPLLMLGLKTTLIVTVIFLLFSLITSLFRSL